MKKTILIVIIFLLFNSVCYGDQSSLIENMVLGIHSDEVITFIEDIKENKNYKKISENNFYKPLKDIKVFGFSISYIGIGGLDMILGPNVIVRGGLTEVSGAVKKHSEIMFKCGPEGCGSKMTDNKQVIIYPFSRDKNMTVIQCRIRSY